MRVHRKVGSFFSLTSLTLLLVTGILPGIARSLISIEINQTVNAIACLEKVKNDDRVARFNETVEVLQLAARKLKNLGYFIDRANIFHYLVTSYKALLKFSKIKIAIANISALFNTLNTTTILSAYFNNKAALQLVQSQAISVQKSKKLAKIITSELKSKVGILDNQIVASEQYDRLYYWQYFILIRNSCDNSGWLTVKVCNSLLTLVVFIHIIISLKTGRF